MKISLFYYILLSLFALVSTQKRGSFTLGSDAEKTCLSYGILCPYGKVCAIQHIQVPRPITIPVCIPEKYVPVNSDACYLPPEPGECDAQFTRWYFNRHSKQCSWFQYGGCNGNENRFHTKDECEETCKGAKRFMVDIDEKIKGSHSYHQLNHQRYEGEEIEADSDGKRELMVTPRLLPLEANTRVVTVPNVAKSRRNLLKRRKKRKRICGKNCQREKQNRRKNHNKTRKNYRKNSPGLTRRNHSNESPKKMPPIAIRMPPSVSRTYNDDQIGANRFLPGGASVHRLFSLLHSQDGSASWRKYRS